MMHVEDYVRDSEHMNLKEMGECLVQSGWNRNRFNPLVTGSLLLIADALQKIAKHKDEE